jgi:hypothetical protein
MENLTHFQYQKDNNKIYNWYNQDNGVYLPDEIKMFLKIQIRDDRRLGFKYTQYFHHWGLKSLRSLDTIKEIEEQHINYENSGFKLIETIKLSHKECKDFDISMGELIIYRTDKINEYIPMCPIGLSLGYMSSNNEMIQLKVYHK